MRHPLRDTQADDSARRFDAWKAGGHLLECASIRTAHLPTPAPCDCIDPVERLIKLEAG